MVITHKLTALEIKILAAANNAEYT